MLWRVFAGPVSLSYFAWECAGVGTYVSLCDGGMWGESGRVGCIRSTV